MGRPNCLCLPDSKTAIVRNRVELSCHGTAPDCYSVRVVAAHYVFDDFITGAIVRYPIDAVAEDYILDYESMISPDIYAVLSTVRDPVALDEQLGACPSYSIIGCVQDPIAENLHPVAGINNNVVVASTSDGALLQGYLL
ncbi:hypothetical protein BMS3Abin13_00049 [bacterium BMS3Abin13]|nr:hypothetical protein BMS3Abin13_00049 [bacterium BMS3Abin13]